MAESISYSITSKGKTLRGEAAISTCSRREALARGAVAWGVLWLVMVPTVFIPVVHFISVPALLIAGPIVGRMIYKLYNHKRNIRVESAVCPNCEGKLDLPGAFENWPVNHVCMDCKTSYSALIDNLGSESP